MAEPTTRTRARAFAKSWKKPYLVTLLLSLMGPAGVVVYAVLTDAAWRKMMAACKEDPVTPYIKGHPFALPVGAMVLSVLGMALLIVVLTVGGRKPIWAMVVAAIAIAIASLSVMFLGLISDHYHEYPGNGPSNASGSPCPHE
ncbi:hypothetical protein GCM10010191_53390 [Actinomadura vinacea]|uniref:Uncharacterized protein n=1 Tax=Actinomadura vinacea TaxID=115336 RepID=A0ABN3JMP4_9ACTN